MGSGFFHLGEVMAEHGEEEEAKGQVIAEARNSV